MLLEQIEQLYEAQLYDDVQSLCGIALTLSEHNAEQLSVMSRYQLLCYQADAFYHSALYRQAEATYQSALQLRKGVVRGKTSKAHSSEALSEVEVRYRLHQCYVQLKQFKDAVQTLKSINPRQRTCKVNLALARLYQRTGANDRSAVTAFKDVLRECPLSLVSLQALLQLGVRVGELETLLRGALPPGANISDWLGVWLRGQAQLAGQEYGGAVQTLRALDCRPLLRNNVQLLTTLGLALHLHGDHPSALTTLQRAHDLDPRSLLQMDLLARLYFTEQRRPELESERCSVASLASSLVLTADNHPEPWIAMGYLSCADKKFPRAVYFAQKALCVDARSVEALLLKGAALLDSKKEQEAVQHYREALRLAPHRYEPYSCLVTGYLATDRVREALACAAESCKQLYCARTLTLYGSVLAREPLSVEKAKDCLERALKLDPSHLDAVYALVGILGQQQNYPPAIKLLRGALQRQVTSRLHRLLADLLLRTGDTLGATQHFEHALNIDPRNTKACEGLARLEKHADLPPADRTFDINDDIMDSSDNEVKKPYPVQPSPALYLAAQLVHGGCAGIVVQPGAPAPPLPSPASLQPSHLHTLLPSLSPELVASLIDQRPGVLHEKGFGGLCLLHRAALSGDVRVVRLLLLRGADPNAQSDHAETPFHHACKRGSVVAIHALLEGGADLRAEDRGGKGALHHTAQGGSVRALHYLMETCGLSARVRDNALCTPAHIVCTHGHIEAFQYLMKNDRVDVSARDVRGDTLLHVAAQHGSSAMCWALLQAGGLPLLAQLNSDGFSALDLARRADQHKFNEVVRLLSFYMSRSAHRPPHGGGVGGRVVGPVWAWWGLLMLPGVLYPLTLVAAAALPLHGPPTLLGLGAMVALRLFHSHRINHVSRWPSPAHAGMFFAGLFYTMLHYYTEILPYIYMEHSWFVGISLLLTVVIVYLYAVLLTRDPGVVRAPRHKPSGAYFSISDVATELCQPSEFCIACELVPPQQSTHCRLCERCYEGVDHHCLYLYRCIARHNHRPFFLFTLATMLAMLLYICSSLLCLRALHPLLAPAGGAESSIGGVVWEVFETRPAAWSLLVLNVLSLVWGVWLLRVQLAVIAGGGPGALGSMALPHQAQGRRRGAMQGLRNIALFLLDGECLARESTFTA